MTATIVPFPIVRRHGFVDRQAEHASHMNPDGRLRYLNHQLRLQADAMRRKGISEDLIERELRCMGRALAMMTGRGGGKTSAAATASIWNEVLLGHGGDA